METQTARPVGEIIPGSMAYAKALTTITSPLPKPDRKWLDKWLRLDTGNLPVLQEFELQVQKFCSGFFKNPREGYLLFVYGNNGTSKTLAFEAIRRWFNTVCRTNYFVERENVVRMPYGQFWSFPRLLRELKGGDYDKGGNWHMLEELDSCELLGIDEIGGGHDPSTVGVDVLCQLMSRRERRWSYIATNVGPDAWDQKFDRRIASRFFRNSVIIDLSGVPDYSLTHREA